MTSQITKEQGNRADEPDNPPVFSATIGTIVFFIIALIVILAGYAILEKSKIHINDQNIETTEGGAQKAEYLQSQQKILDASGPQSDGSASIPIQKAMDLNAESAHP